MDNPVVLGALVLAMSSATASAMAPPVSKQPLFASLFVESGGTLLVGLDPRGFTRSAKDGRSWIPVPKDEAYASMGIGTPHRSHNIKAELCHPRSGGLSWSCIGIRDTLDAVSRDGVLYKCAADRVRYSRDMGKTWVQSAPWNIAPAAPDYCIRIAANGNVIYALGEVLHRSDDHGHRWHPVTQRGSMIIAGEKILSLEADKAGWLLANTVGTELPVGSVFESADGGRLWKRQTFGLPAQWRHVRLLRVLDNAVFVAASKSERGREEMVFMITAGSQPVALQVAATSALVDLKVGPDGAIYMIRERSIHYSHDKGITWTQLPQEGILLP